MGGKKYSSMTCPVAKLLSDKVHMKSHLLWMKGSNGGHGDRGQCETKSECGANIFRHENVSIENNKTVVSWNFFSFS